jgi:hypothetical protein
MSRYQENEETKEAIDSLLSVNRSIQCDLGLESDKEAIDFSKAYWKYASEKIAKHDPDFWEVIKHQD